MATPNSTMSWWIGRFYWRQSDHLPDGDRRNLIVFDARYCEAQSLAFQTEGRSAPRPQQLNGFHLFTRWQCHPDDLRAERVDRLHPTVMRVGVGVVEKVDSVAGVGLPCEEFDETFAVDVDDALVTGDPADRVVQEP